MLASCTDGHLLLHDLEAGSVQARVKSFGRVRKLMGVRREGATDLVLAMTTEHVLIWDPDTGRTQQLGVGPAAHPVQILGSGDRVALAFERKGWVQVWEVQASHWRQIGTTQVGKITAMVALPPGRSQWRVATAGETGVRVWDSASTSVPRDDEADIGPVTALTVLPTTVDGAAGQKMWVVGTHTGIDIFEAKGERISHMTARDVHALYATREGSLVVPTDQGASVWDFVSEGRLQVEPLRREVPGIFRRAVSNTPSCLLDGPSGPATVATVFRDGVQLTTIGDGRSTFVPIRFSAAPRSVVGLPGPDGIRGPNRSG